MPRRARARPTCEPTAIGRAAGGGSVHGPVGAVGVEGQGQPIALQHGPHGAHDRRDAFAPLPQLGVQQLLGGVVDDGDEGEPSIRGGGQPGVTTAIEMQRLAKTRAGLPAPTMAPTRAVFGHEPRRLQGLPDKGIAEAHAVLPPRELMEMPHVEPLIALPVERQQALDLGHRRPFRRRHAPPPIEQAVIAGLLQAPSPPPHGARA